MHKMFVHCIQKGIFAKNGHIVLSSLIKRYSQHFFLNMFIGQNQGCPVWPILKPKLMGWCSGMGWGGGGMGGKGRARGEPVFTNVQVLVFRQFYHWSPFFLFIFFYFFFPPNGFSNIQRVCDDRTTFPWRVSYQILTSCELHRTPSGWSN